MTSGVFPDEIVKRFRLPTHDPLPVVLKKLFHTRIDMQDCADYMIMYVSIII